MNICALLLYSYNNILSIKRCNEIYVIILSCTMVHRNTLYFAAASVIAALTLWTLHRALTHTEYDYTQANSSSKRKRAVFFGDSITQHGMNPDIYGWLCGCSDWWVRRVDVLNRGFSGYNSRWALQIVEEVVVPERPDLIFIFFGANDAVDSLVGQHVPLVEYGQNLQKIVSILRMRLPNAKLILITPPPIWEPKLEEMNIGKGKYPTLDRTNDRTLQYVNACVELGKKFNIPVVNAWESMEGWSDLREKYLSDGLHLNVEGNTRLLAAVKDVVTKAYPDWIPDAIPMHMNGWAEMIELERKH